MTIYNSRNQQLQDSVDPEETNVYFQSLDNSIRKHLDSLQLTHHSEDSILFLHEAMSNVAEDRE